MREVILGPFLIQISSAMHDRLRTFEPRALHWKSGPRPIGLERRFWRLLCTGYFPLEISRPLRLRGEKMELLWPLAILAIWIALQAWVLPRFGVKT